MAIAAQEAAQYAQQVQEAAGIGAELARRMQILRFDPSLKLCCSNSIHV
jgi:hypothetical protein